MLKSIPPEVPDMDILDYVTLVTVSEMAAGMTKDEVLGTFSIDASKLSKDEKIAFDEFYNFGRGMAVRCVVQNLIDSSKGRNGSQSAMAFLRRFAKEFESDIEGDPGGSFSFTFGEKQ